MPSFSPGDMRVRQRGWPPARIRRWSYLAELTDVIEMSQLKAKISPDILLDEQSIEERIIVWRNDPVLYCVERLGIQNIPQIPHECRMLRALPESMLDRKPIVVPSGHAMGKDYTISGCASLWFAECFGPCKVIMTGPTDRQVREIMWSELERAYNNRTVKDNFGRLITCKLDIREDWFILAFTTKESGDSAGKFQGAHSPRIMIIVSEAQAVEDRIYDQIDGLTTSGSVLQVFLGNPLRTTGRFAKMIRDTTRNRIIHLDCYESPNVIAGRDIVPGMVSKAWVDEKESLWNEDKSGMDPRYRSKVRGLLPTTSVNTVISEDLFNKCVNKTMFAATTRGSIGVDPGRFGDDDMVISVWESGRLLERKILPKCDATEGAGEVVVMQKKHFPAGQISIVFDCDGLGGPYLDIAKKMVPDDLEIVWIEFHGSCSDREIVGQEYHNHRAEAAFWAKEQMDQGMVSLDENEFAKEEAIAEQYFVNLRGKIQLEDKDEIKERLGRSPDRWDADKLAIWGFKYAPVIRKKDAYRKAKSGMLPAYESAMSA